MKVAACLHVTAETANLMNALAAGGAEVGALLGQPADHPGRGGRGARGRRRAGAGARAGEDAEAYAEHVRALAEWGPDITLDDGADLLVLLHERGERRRGARRRRGDHHRPAAAAPARGARAGSPAR